MDKRKKILCSIAVLVLVVVCIFLVNVNKEDKSETLDNNSAIVSDKKENSKETSKAEKDSKQTKGENKIEAGSKQTEKQNNTAVDDKEIIITMEDNQSVKEEEKIPGKAEVIKRGTTTSASNETENNIVKNGTTQNNTIKDNNKEENNTAKNKETENNNIKDNNKEENNTTKNEETENNSSEEDVMDEVVELPFVPIQ